MLGLGLLVLRNSYNGLPPDWASTAVLIENRGATFFFLAWNLLLAWIPYGLSAALGSWPEHPKGWLYKSPLLLLWLLFLPNAPYLITDLIHLKPRPPIPFWLDAATFFLFAFTGLLLALASLLQVQRFLAQGISGGMTRLAIAFSIGACSLGLYLGRFLRWNSWDAILQPGEVIASLVDNLQEPPTSLAFCLFFFPALLGISYHFFAPDGE